MNNGGELESGTWGYMIKLIVSFSLTEIKTEDDGDEVAKVILSAIVVCYLHPTLAKSQGASTRRFRKLHSP